VWRLKGGWLRGEETICAVATGSGAAGVAIVRLSGAAAHSIAAALSGLPIAKLRHGRLRLVDLHDLGERIDQGYIVIFEGPRSFTGEDVAELQVHGSVAITRRIIAAMCRLGARPAERGEFSRRAFLAGKLDLAQAEGLLDLISASSEAARATAMQHLDGRVGDAIKSVRAPIIAAMADIEARLDFSTAEDVGSVPAYLRDDLRATAARLRGIAATAEAGKVRMRGARVAMYGAPNAGKSTLFNTLVGADRALVHHAPGTTRDVIEAQGELAGIAVTWIDTAGVRQADQTVEAAGIERAQAAAASADVVVWLTDGSAPKVDLTLPPGPAHREVLRVLSKADRPLHDDFKTDQQTANWLRVSVLDGARVKEIMQRVGSLVEQFAQPSVASDLVLTRDRQATAMLRAATALDRAVQMLDRDNQLELAAADLHDASAALAEVTGQIAPDDVLDAVFSQFCIGK
jgi:tRNA modification GTPase